jgi:hypothetical protein
MAQRVRRQPQPGGRGDRALTISGGRQRVAPRRLELLMASELGDHHQIVAGRCC